MSKKIKIIAALALVAVFAAISSYFYFRTPAKEIDRAQVLAWLEDGSIESAHLSPSPYPGIYTLRGDHKDRPAKFEITTHLDDAQVQALLAIDSAKIMVPEREMKRHVLNLLPTVLIVLLLAGFLAYYLTIGKSKHHHRIKDRPETRFADVAGIDEAKSEVQEVVDFLRDPKKYKKLGGKLPKGVLLIGPPGTGKTMLARAIAGEAKANFFSAHGSDFNEIFVGVGAKRIREIFRKAAKNKPAIIFIDEIDCLGKKRNMDTHSEMQQTNNALLAAMDGFEASDGIIVVGATNRPEDLDDALTRPGRFDRKVHVPLPDMRGRRGILAVHGKDKPILDMERSLDVIAQTTPEMSGADLASIINEAAILCAQKNESEMTLADLEESRDKVRWGKERKSMVLRKEEREMVAYHEAGHTIINLQKALLPPLYKVSIIPRGGALGVTTLLPTEDQNIHSKTFLLEELVVLMGGRAAERIFYGATTNGAHGDLHTAKNIARKMIIDWGMGEKLYYEPEKSHAEDEINRLLEAADHEALSIIQAQRENTHKLAQALLTFETLTREQVIDLLYEGTHPSIPATNLSIVEDEPSALSAQAG